MSGFVVRINSGSIFPVDTKETEKHPDYTGKCAVECHNCHAVTDMWVSGWVKPMKARKEMYVSMSFTAMDEQTDRTSADRPDTSGIKPAEVIQDRSGGGGPSTDDLDKDIPF